ncbi:MAG TPA: hypothetical protein VM077_04075 [Candidatus Limnocylindrales bacterium]|nr:hypothetical protein [Candidatus Limnocylindrales bacterium]
MVTEKEKRNQQRQEAGLRYIAALERLEADPKSIDAAKKVLLGPTHEERQAQISANQLEPRKTLMQWVIGRRIARSRRQKS